MLGASVCMTAFPPPPKISPRGAASVPPPPLSLGGGSGFAPPTPVGLPGGVFGGGQGVWVLSVPDTEVQEGAGGGSPHPNWGLWRSPIWGGVSGP